MFEYLKAVQIIFSLAIALFFLTYLIIPKVAKVLKARIKYGIDVHKPQRPKVAECGGIVILFSISIFLLFAYMMLGDIRIVYVMLVAMMFSLYGLVDDIVRLGKYQKLIVSFAIAAVGTFLYGATGLFFILSILFLIAASNIFNIFAGLNGLEIGFSTIIAFFFAAASFLLSQAAPFFMSVGMFLVLLAFLLHNKYPARIFPGDVGTLLIGGFFASMTLYYGMYIVLVPLLGIHILDCLFKGCSSGYFSSHEKKPTKILGNGMLKPRDDFLSVVRMLLKIKPMTEKMVVKILWSFEILIGIATVSILVII
ncbi:MAG: hypothetical protein ACE5J7_03410 [Candidatus Aenigmatarchaeota archaeon]